MDMTIRVCPRCQAPFTATASGQVCAACALERALAADDGSEDTANNGAFPRPFGAYELLGEVGRGGMGLVFRARQPSLGRLVALKVLLYGSFSDKAGRQRLRAEAESAARLQHPNIVAVHEVGEQDGVPYLTMDLVDGPDLGRLCDGRPLPAKTAAQQVRDIARAVQAAHDAGVLHRDLKPSNILVGSDGRPRVTDFGLAKRDDATASLGLTATGQVLGSPSYTSPEQAAGRPHAVAAPSDVYGLGAILYHTITGRAPFVASTATQTLRLVLEAEPVAPHLLNPGLPRDLETICLKCLQKDPSRRYPTATALADDLDRFLTQRPILARPVSPLGRGWRWCRRHPAVAALTACLFLVLTASSVVANRQARRTERAMTLAERAQQSAVESRGEAERLLNWMLDDLSAELERSGRRDQVAGLAPQAVAYYEKLPPETRSPETRRRQARALSKFGSALVAQSKFAEAVQPAQQAVAMLEQLRQEGDASEATLTALAEARFRALAGYERTGQSGLRLQASEQLLALVEPHAGPAGASFAIRRWYALALRQVGLGWVQSGNDSRGLGYYERALVLERDLARSPEADDSLTIETAATLINLALVLGRQSDHRVAIRALLEESAAALQRELAGRPANLRALETLGRLQDTLGDFFVGELNARDALHWRQQAIATWERCTLLDPSLPDYQYNIHLSQGSARYVQAAQGQVGAALAGWHDELDACTPLRGSAYSLSNLSLHWHYLATWLARSGDRRGAEEALAQHRAAAARARGQAASQDPASRQNHEHDSITAAETAFHLGDFAAARTEAQAVLARIAQLPEMPRARARWIERPARSLLAWLELLAGDNSAAVAITAMNDPPPTNRFKLRCEYAELTTPCALALARLGRDAEARALIEPAVVFFREALAAEGARCASLEDLAWALYVEAGAQPPGAGDRRAALLAEAAALIAAMTDDYRALSSVRRLRDWLDAEQPKSGGA